MERTWTGRIRPGDEQGHQQFVAWLSSDEGAASFSRALLTSYHLVEQDGRLTVSFAAPEPPVIIRFLRNRRFWPEFWEFESADRAAALGDGALERVHWSAGEAAQ
jgi:hypothetical protein